MCTAGEGDGANVFMIPPHTHTHTHFIEKIDSVHTCIEAIRRLILCVLDLYAENLKSEQKSKL